MGDFLEGTKITWSELNGDEYKLYSMKVAYEDKHYICLYLDLPDKTTKSTTDVLEMKRYLRDLNPPFVVKLICANVNSINKDED